VIDAKIRVFQRHLREAARRQGREQVCVSAISGISGVGAKPSSTGARTLWASVRPAWVGSRLSSITHAASDPQRTSPAPIPRFTREAQSVCRLARELRRAPGSPKAESLRFAASLEEVQHVQILVIGFNLPSDFSAKASLPMPPASCGSYED
jgi:hypothetical protein